MGEGRAPDLPRTWRTNIGLRLTAELGAWVEAQCAFENRTLANYVETLIKRDHATRPTPSKDKADD